MYKQFNIKKGDVITITGSGGKTSLMFTLANELSTLGKVLVTTTTKIYVPQNSLFEELLLSDFTFKGSNKNIFVAGKKIIDNKLQGLSYEEINRLKNDFDFVLIEGDGAKEKLLKEWSEFEPCIPNFSNKIIGVVNMDILNNKLTNENVHRFELFADKFSNYIYQNTSKDFLVEYILKAQYFKNSQTKDKYIFFNGIDGENLLDKFSLAIATCNTLTQNNFAPKLILGSVKEGIIYPFVPVSAIVMASGFSKRMGQNKIKLLYNGVSLLENILDKIKLSNFYEVIVCGREPWTENITQKFNFKYIDNKLASLGQSESIKLGVLNSTGKGYVFFPADQVLLSTYTIEKLYYNFEKYGYITIPTSCGNRFSPVFFPANKKEELLNLEGDRGGKNIIKNTPTISLVDFPYDDEFLDIDTPSDYQYISKK